MSRIAIAGALSAVALSFRLSAAQIVQRPDARVVVLEPVHSSDPDDLNKSYSKYTPVAKFDFTVTNPDVFDLLEPGVVYKLLMVREDSGAQLTYTLPQPEPDAGTSGDASGETGAPETPLAPVTDPAAQGVTGDGTPTPPVAPTGSEETAGDPPVVSDPPAAPAASDTPVIDAAAAAAAATASSSEAPQA